MDKNTRSRHIAESPVRRDVDRRRFLKLTGAGLVAALPISAADTAPASMRQEESHMWMTIGERRFAITLSDNAAARAFAAQLPLTLDMSELNGNEKHGELAARLAQFGATALQRNKQGHQFSCRTRGRMRPVIQPVSR